MPDRVESLLSPEKIVKENNGYRPDQYLDAKCPMLSALMSIEEWKGVSRQRATLLFFVEQGKAKFGINDKQNERMGWGSLDTLEGAFEEVERLLAEDKVDWRPYSKYNRK